MEADPTRMGGLLVGLGDVDLVGINDLGEDGPLEVVPRFREPRPVCDGCGGRMWPKGYRSIVFGGPSGLQPGRYGCGGGNVAGCARTPTVR